MTNGEYMYQEALGVICGDQAPTPEQAAQAKQCARDYHDRCKAQEEKQGLLFAIDAEYRKSF